jgi:hypothetical protein
MLKESNAPRKPPRIILMGPPGVELVQHSEQISKRYGLVSLEMDSLLKEFSKKDNSE